MDNLVPVNYEEMQRNYIRERGYLALQYSAIATPQTMPHKHWRSNKKNIAIKTLNRAKLIL